MKLSRRDLLAALVAAPFAQKAAAALPAVRQNPFAGLFHPQGDLARRFALGWDTGHTAPAVQALYEEMPIEPAVLPPALEMPTMNLWPHLPTTLRITLYCENTASIWGVDCELASLADLNYPEALVERCLAPPTTPRMKPTKKPAKNRSAQTIRFRVAM